MVLRRVDLRATFLAIAPFLEEEGGNEVLRALFCRGGGHREESHCRNQSALSQRKKRPGHEYTGTPRKKRVLASPIVVVGRSRTERGATGITSDQVDQHKIGYH